MTDLSRRALLQLAAALGVAACADELATPGDDVPAGPGDAPPTADAGPRADAALPTPPPDAGPPPPTVVPGIDLDALPSRTADFPFGVMAGDATASNVMLWTRYTGAGTLSVQLEREGAPKGEATVSRVLAAGERGDGGFAHVDAGGLFPGSRYRYAFFVEEGGKPVARGPFGFVRAAIAPDALDVITFAGTSCTHQNGAPYPGLADAAKRKVDFFLHGGDHVYTDAGTDAVSLAQYRAKYAEAWAASGMRALHGSTGMVLTWDDHEILNNWNPETFSATRLDVARKTFFEHRATRRDPASPNRLWRRLTWGKTLDLFVLDVRSERKPSTRAAATAEFISPAQMAWLKQGLETSGAVFKLILTSVPISNFPAAAAGEADKWEGYPAQRNEILGHVATKAIGGVWWLSGDLHFGCIGSVGTSAAQLKMREVLMGPGGTAARDDITLAAPQFERVIEEKNYTLFRADPVKRELTITFVREDGTTIFTKVYPA